MIKWSLSKGIQEAFRSMDVIESLTTIPTFLMYCIMVLGVALLIAEIYLVSFGLFAASGLIALVVGVALVVRTQTDWAGDWVGKGMGMGMEPAIALATKIVMGVISSLMLIIASVAVFRSQRDSRRRYADLRQLTGPDAGNDSQSTELAEVIARVTPTAPGKIFYRGTYWTARLSSQKGAAALQTIEAGKMVKILSWDGLIARVVIDAENLDAAQSNFSTAHHPPT
jgi:membrane-bound ClpP family serine protease